MLSNTNWCFRKRRRATLKGDKDNGSLSASACIRAGELPAERRTGLEALDCARRFHWQWNPLSAPLGVRITYIAPRFGPISSVRRTSGNKPPRSIS